MSFHSLDYLIFIFFVVVTYWKISSQYRIKFLILMSIIFYCFFNWKYFPLILISAITDFFASRAIYNSSSQSTKNLILLISLIINLSILSFFKYSDYLGNHSIPLGISFYTFQTISYTVECYRGNFKPEKSFSAFFLYVIFFPQLIAGPIETPSLLLTQIKKRTRFNLNNLKDGLFIFLWGLTKKLFVADSLAPVINNFFYQSESSTYTVFITGLVMIFRIYYDFSAYTDMAVGTAKMLGYNLSLNFRPFFLAKSLREFWSKYWHITLGKWVKNYLYVPILKYVTTSKIIATFITFLVIALWHGIGLNWLLFGLFNWLIITIQNTILRVKPKLSIFIRLSMFPVFSILGLLHFSDTPEKLNFLSKSILNFDGNLALTIPIIKYTSLYLLPVAIPEIYFETKTDPYYYLKLSNNIKYVFIGYCLALITALSHFKEFENYIYFQF